MPLSASDALQSLQPELALLYEDVLKRLREDIQSVDGARGMHEVLLERFAFVYVATRSLELEWRTIDLQRYNQLLGIWLKIGSDLLASYKELYSKSVVERRFIGKVMDVVSSEVSDTDVLKRIRDRLASAANSA